MRYKFFPTKSKPLNIEKSTVFLCIYDIPSPHQNVY